MNKQLTNVDWLEVKHILDLISISSDAIKFRANKEQIVLFGVGIYGEIALKYFEKENIKVSYFCDNDPAKQGGILDEIPVISPGELCKLIQPFVIITARHSVQVISKQLKDMQIEHVSFDAYFVKENCEKYKYVLSNLIHDSCSKRVFMSILKSMLTGKKEFCQSVMEDSAFWALPEFTNTGNEIFVDAGAYVGDTIEQFIWKNIGSFKKIYAFEPGSRQFRAMQHRLKRLIEEWDIDSDKIVCIKGGLGEIDTELPYRYNETAPLGSNFLSISGNEEVVKIYSLDNYIKNDTITFIKADIEGFEMEMLKGAKAIIERCKPKMALSIYHRPEDLYEIPIYIKSLVPEYKMAIRHHAPALMDTVLYCWL